MPGFSVNATGAECFIPKRRHPPFQDVTPVLTRPRRHESENEDLSVFCSLLTKKAAPLEAVIISEEPAF